MQHSKVSVSLGELDIKKDSTQYNMIVKVFPVGTGEERLKPSFDNPYLSSN